MVSFCRISKTWQLLIPRWTQLGIKCETGNHPRDLICPDTGRFFAAFGLGFVDATGTFLDAAGVKPLAAVLSAILFWRSIADSSSFLRASSS